MPNLVILNAGPDTAGCSIGLKRAFDKYTDWETRAICRKTVWLGYTPDIVWPKDATPEQTAEVMDIVRAADVLHVMDYEYALTPFRDLLAGKTIVVHHLGTHFRRDPAGVSANAAAYGAIQVTDSIDLMLFPHISWLPVTTDLDSMAALRKRLYKRSKRVRIAHAPTSREIKSTDIILSTVEALTADYAYRGVEIDFDVIEGVSNAECLERKATADIFVDQLDLGFGVNCIEAWGMGIPVVSGWRDDEPRRKSLEMWGRLPWADANEKTLVSVIEHLIESPKWRAELGEIGKQHAQRWHSEKSVVEQTLKVYGSA
jgi:hypothetical protein